MKMRYTLASTLILAAASLANGQVVNSGTFFAPAFRAAHADDPGFIIPNIDPAQTSATQSAGGVSWTNRASGYVGLTLALAEGNLMAYTETTGNRLVFGRSLDTEILGGSANDLLNPLLGASVASSWSARAVVGNLDIDAGQLYRVSFDVNGGGGLPVGLLGSSSFGIADSGITGQFGQSATLLNVLNLVNIGSGTPTTGPFEFVFTSNIDRSSLTFDFAAQAAAQLGLLGGTDGNREILSFSNFQVVAVPEPASSMLSVFFAGCLIMRRRRTD